LLFLSPPLFPPILPTCTIHTPFRLFTDILPAKLALDLLLHNIVVRPTTIHTSNHPQAHRDNQEAHNLVDEGTVREHDGTVTKRLILGVVARRDGRVVVGPVFHGGELLVEVPREEGEEGNEGKNDVGYEGVGACCEGGG
jgi:hypothetical protein